MKGAPLHDIESVVLLPVLPKSVASSRVYGSAAFQNALLRRREANSKLILGNSVVRDGDIVSTTKELFSMFGSPSLEPLEQVLSGGDGRNITLWLTPQAFEQKVFRAFYKEFISGKPHVTFKCPSSNWLFGYPDEFFEVEELSSEEIFSLLFLLVGDIPSKDLDLNAAKYQEKENIYWLSTSLLLRLKDSALSDVGELNTEPLENFTSLFFEGATQGEVTRLVGEYRKFLFSVLSWLGAPPRERESRNSGKEDIISGIVNVVSDMISLHG